MASFKNERSQDELPICPHCREVIAQNQNTAEDGEYVVHLGCLRRRVERNGRLPSW
jgi:hypothetical protein